MQTNPEQWAVELANEVAVAVIVNPSGSVTPAALTIQAAFAEREASECDVMLKVTWHDAPKPEAKELGRRAKLAQELLLNGEVAQQAEREARLVGAMKWAGEVSLPVNDFGCVTVDMSLDELNSMRVLAGFKPLPARKDRTNG